MKTTIDQIATYKTAANNTINAVNADEGSVNFYTIVLAACEGCNDQIRAGVYTALVYELKVRGQLHDNKFRRALSWLFGPDDQYHDHRINSAIL